MTQPPDRDSPYDRPAPVFDVFEEGQSAWIGALYEFTTASGDYVYLHEMDCVDMQYRPQSRQLTLTFECVSSDLMPTSVAVLTFDDTEIYDWGTTFATLDPSTDVRVRGQVSALTCMDDSPDGSNLR